MQRLRKSVLALLVIFSISCASVPRSPEGTIAEYGEKIAGVVGSLQEVIGTVGKTTNDQTVRDYSVKALDALEEVNQKGIQLAQLLRAIDESGGVDVPNNVQEARNLLTSINALIALNVGGIGERPEFAEAANLVEQLLNLIGSVQYELGKES